MRRLCNGESNEMRSLINDIRGRRRLSTRLVNREDGLQRSTRSPSETTSSDGYFRAETEELTIPADFDLARQRSASKNLPEDNSAFPAATWFKTASDGQSSFLMNSMRDTLRRIAILLLSQGPCRRTPPTSPGSSLISESLNRRPISDWIAHLQTTLADLLAVDSILREEIRHRYLMLEYAVVRVSDRCFSDPAFRQINTDTPTVVPTSGDQRKPLLGDSKMQDLPSTSPAARP